VLEVFNQNLSLRDSARVLLLVPGPHAPALVTGIRCDAGTLRWTMLDSSRERLNELRLPLLQSAQHVLGKATRLPFRKHSFDAVISFEALFAIRPPWTVLAEFHRVLEPDGTLILFEPQSLGFFSSLRDKLHGPGKRVFPLDELKFRLKRCDYAVESIGELHGVPGFSRPAFCVRATKIENPVEPAPEVTTTREMLERRKNKLAGE